MSVMTKKNGWIREFTFRFILFLRLQLSHRSTICQPISSHKNYLQRENLSHQRLNALDGKDLCTT